GHHDDETRDPLTIAGTRDGYLSVRVRCHDVPQRAACIRIIVGHTLARLDRVLTAVPSTVVHVAVFRLRSQGRNLGSRQHNLAFFSDCRPAIERNSQIAAVRYLFDIHSEVCGPALANLTVLTILTSRPALRSHKEWKRHC